MFTKKDLIHVYTRKQALADGILIDVSSTALEAGFTFPVAVTRAVWEQCVVVPDGASCQDESGRLWDVLTMLRFAIRCGPKGREDIHYRLHVRNDNRDRTSPLVDLKAACGPADAGSPCITIMQPDED